MIRVIVILMSLNWFCNAIVDIDKRTRGIPMDVSHEGNFFCFAFLRNKALTEPFTGREAPRNLGIFITTLNSNPVGYRIRSGSTGYTRTGTVTAGTIVRKEYMTPNVQEVNTATNPLAGIIVETINSSQTIQVMGFSDSFGSSDGFLAVPIIHYKSNFTYDYASLTASARSFNSMVAVVACGDIAQDDITYSTENPFFVLSSFVKGGFVLPNQKTFSSATMSEYNTLGLLRASQNDLTGFRASSNQPIGFMTGHECGEIQRGEDTCGHIIEQIPPSYTWGYNFFIAPFEERRGYVFKVWPRYNGTSFTVYCSDGTNFNISNIQFNEINVDNRQRFELNSQSYCYIQSDRPLLVMQYGFSHEHDNNNQFGNPNMVLVAPISQYLKKHVFTTNVSMYTRQNNDFTHHFISVTVLARYFVPNSILLDGTPLEPDVTKWSIINCSQNDPCGYGISKIVNIGTHTVQHTNPNASINVIVYGWRIEKGYAYPAGYGMNPIGETFYSLVALNESALENSQGSMIVRVYRSGDVSQSSSLNLRTFTTFGDNAATIGPNGDLISQTQTVFFVSYQTFVDVSFVFMDDTTLESDETFGVELVPRNDLTFGVPSSVILTIIDDDDTGITIFFIPIHYNITEGINNVTVTLRAQTSNPLPTSSSIRIRDQSTGSATSGVDYVAFDEIIDLQAGSTGFTYNVTIISNPGSEPAETFNAIMSFVLGGTLIVTHNTATIQILGDDDCSCNAIVDIDKRTRGIPMDVSHEGNFFCFAFIRNRANMEPFSGREAPRNLGIFITTHSSNPVGYQIRSSSTGYTRTGTVTAGTIVREEYMTPNVAVVDRTTSPSAGIIVETINSSQRIQVMGFSDSFGSSDGFLAVPIIQYRSNFRYDYASLSASALTFNSIIAIVACGDISEKDITYSTESTDSCLVFSPYIKDGFAFSAGGDFFSGTMNEYNTLGLRKSSQYDFTGFRASSNQPIGYMTGHECAEIQLGEQTCDHIIEQIPPSYTWGYNFFVAPFEERTGYVFKVWPRYNDTSFTVYCSDGTNFNISNIQFNEININNRQRFELNSQSYCYIQSDRPLLVMQYGFSHEHDNNNQFGDPNMVLVAPISQYLNKHVFTTNVSMYTRQNDDFASHYISVTVLARYFVPNSILLDGTPLEPDVTKWSIINCSHNDPCGYGISKRVNIGTHTVQHTNPNASINVIVYGWRIEKGYAYPAGYGMNPIGETFYSLVALNESSLENSEGPMIVRVYRSGDVSQSSTVNLRTFTTSGHNAATIGRNGDLKSQTRTVSFVSDQTFVDVSFVLMDDTTLESDETFGVELVQRNDLTFGIPSSVILTIIDDDNTCPDNKPAQYCYNNPCNHQTCCNFPDAQCVLDNCGQCKARFIVNGTDVTYQCKSCTVQGAIFKPCGATCVDTCSTRKKNLPVICSAFCKAGCTCQAGQIVDESSNRCVYPDHCSCPTCVSLPTNCTQPVNDTCGCSVCGDCSIEGQVYQQSRTCPKTCSNPHMFCIGNVSGCGCPPGQLIDEDRNRCVHPYDCPKKNPCHQPPFTGPCHGTFLRYFFNVTSQKCETFIYGGCYGNGNSYLSLHECQQQCSACPPTCSVEFCSVRKSAICSIPMTSGVNCQSDNCTITNCWACYYSYNILPFPKIPPSCPHECENPLDEVCMEKWGRCVHESFLNIYNKILPQYIYPENFHCWNHKPCV